MEPLENVKSVEVLRLRADDTLVITIDDPGLVSQDSIDEVADRVFRATGHPVEKMLFVSRGIKVSILRKELNG